jgi:uncharacterized membrane protein
MQLAVFVVPIVMLVIALGAMPWGYYQLLRLVVAATCAIIASIFGREKQNSGASALFIVFIMLALAYNPFIPLRLGRGAWEILNVATIVLLIAGLAFVRRRSRHLQL